MSQLFSNYAVSQLVSGITDTDTTIDITPLDGGKFQAPGGQDEFELLVLTDGSSWEIVKCTGRTNDQMTIERAYEGVAKAWDSGTLVKSTATKATMENFIQRGEYTSAIHLFNYLHFK